MDVGAVSDRPRAIDNRPYEFYCWKYAFRNTIFLQIFEAFPQQVIPLLYCLALFLRMYIFIEFVLKLLIDNRYSLRYNNYGSEAAIEL